MTVERIWQTSTDVFREVRISEFPDEGPYYVLIRTIPKKSLVMNGSELSWLTLFLRASLRTLFLKPHRFFISQPFGLVFVGLPSPVGSENRGGQKLMIRSMESDGLHGYLLDRELPGHGGYGSQERTEIR